MHTRKRVGNAGGGMFPDRENMLHVLQLISVTSERALLSFLSHCYLQKSKPHKGTLRKSERGGVLGGGWDADVRCVMRIAYLPEVVGLGGAKENSGP